MKGQKTIDDVRNFWNENPLYSGELHHPIGTAEWFKGCDQIKYSMFLNDHSQFFDERVKNKSVLDVGCGPGYWDRATSKLPCKYHGIDISDESIKLALNSKEIFKTDGVFKVGDAENIPFDDETFDHVISEGVIHHTPNTQQCINEIYRVLKKGGTASIGLYYKSPLIYNKAMFAIVKFAMRLLNVGLRGRKRESMPLASTPDEFVRMYDGADNPIGKAYDIGEINKMFSKFSSIRHSLFYFPSRIFPFPLPAGIIRLLNKYFGLMICVQVVKK